MKEEQVKLKRAASIVIDVARPQHDACAPQECVLEYVISRDAYEGLIAALANCGNEWTT